MLQQNYKFYHFNGNAERVGMGVKECPYDIHSIEADFDF